MVIDPTIFAGLNLGQAVTPSNPLGSFAEYIDLGVIVLFFILFALGKFRRESEIKEVEKERDRLKEEKDQEIRELKESLAGYVKHYQDDVLPALIEVTKVSAEYVSYLNKRRN